MLKIENLSLSYGNKEILRCINLDILDSTFNAILGENGVGKTTLFKAMIGIVKPKKGNIFINNQNILHLSPKNRSKLISYVPQFWDSPFNYSVFDVVAMGLESRFGILEHLNKTHIDKIHQVLEMLNIQHLAKRDISSLSGGQKALVMLSRALVQDTPVMLLDEPLAHLDIKNQQILLQHISKLKNKIIMINIHDPSLALDYANNIIAIKNKKILFCKKYNAVSKEDLEGIYDIKLMFHKIENLHFIKGDIVGDSRD